MTQATTPLFSAFKKSVIPIIDQALSRFIYFEFTDNRATLEKAIEHSLLAPGKRIRPLLCVATYQLFHPDSKDLNRILPLACAIEMIHTYSLIHDDLPAMDDDDLRRGIPTCHKAFGEDIAILAGDSLNTFAFEVMAKELPVHFSYEKTVHAILMLSHACGIHGMAGGQALDLTNATHDEKGLLLTHALKTGTLLKSCITIPAMVSDASPAIQATLDAFGTKLGLLFQIVDDILDVTQESNTLGKTANKDTEQNKLTYVSLYGLEKAKAIVATEQQACLSLLETLPYNTDLLRELVYLITTREN